MKCAVQFLEAFGLKYMDEITPSNLVLRSTRPPIRVTTSESMILMVAFMILYSPPCMYVSDKLDFSPCTVGFSARLPVKLQGSDSVELYCDLQNFR